MGMASETPAQARQAAIAFLISRWGEVLLARGWVAFPIALLQLQYELKLEPLDVNIVLQLLRYWVDELPFPSQQTLAHDCCVNVRTLRRRLRSMRAAGYLKITLRPEVTDETKPVFKPKYPVSQYDLTPLINIASAMAVRKGFDRPREWTAKRVVRE